MVTADTEKRSTSSQSVTGPVLDWIDRELRDVSDSFSSVHDNVLLELRHIFKESSENVIIGKFYRFLPRLERHHFLLGYRIRQWISLNFQLEASDPLDRVAPLNFSISPLARALPQAKSIFFEFAPETIPFNDIRVTVRRAA